MAKRRSPDSVICVDLTEDDDDREENLQDIRKRFKVTQSAAVATKVKVEAASAYTAMDSDDDDGGGKIGSCAALQQQAMKQEQRETKTLGSSEVEFVPRIEPMIRPIAASAQAASTANDDIEIVGTANESRLPHMRQHCPENKFVPDVFYLNVQARTTEQRRALEDGVQGNLECCDLCFCYVCDMPSKACTNWVSSDKVLFGSYGSNHCHASDTGTDSSMWLTLRKEAKKNMENAPSADTSIHSAFSIEAPGPFKPDDEAASRDASLTKCRKCGWFNRFDHSNFMWLEEDQEHCHSRGTFGAGLHPTGFLDWCHSCGRVASEKDFGKLQAKPYVGKRGDVFLGEKVISFRIVAHDPRQMDRSKERWAINEGSDPKWTYSAAEMEEDVFHHRFGKYPSIEMIMASVPVVAPDKIPATGSLHMENDEWEDIYGVDFEPNRVSADETEAIILENRNDRTLLNELRNFASIGYPCPGGGPVLGGDIVASWDSEGRLGTFTVCIYLRADAFRDASWSLMRSSTPSLSRFLGVWFNVSPFSLSDLCGPIGAEECKKPSNTLDANRTSVPPFRMDEAEFDRACDKIASEMQSAVEKHKKDAKAYLAQLSLNSGASSDLFGGVCSSEVGLDGLLKRYFRETFVEDVNRFKDSLPYGQSNYRSWIDREAGLCSNHRLIRTSGEKCVSKNGVMSRTKFESYLRDEDHALAMSNIISDCCSIEESTGSLKAMLDHLENLHHPSIPFVEGLTVELLEFQRQSVQWALERETTPGGVQSFLWAKLPSVAEPGHEVYFNPILERFRKDKPRLVRGGIIAEEMGLGKTVISLALILQNPAPVAPLSGSPVAVLGAVGSAGIDGADEASSWDKELYSRTSESNSKRGSIICRGTLVVCHVSLVGQWIDEARSKLKDPGLVYPYHGQSRKRDAKTLANNSIVVTTYQTLASDASYHAKRAGDDYCPPCEQVRWWRIICDESHALREASTQKSSAIMNLVGDHKWLVSGTPVNTSLNDLKNQLKFVGLENVDEMFNNFAATVFRHVKDRCVTKKKGFRSWDSRVFGHFTFLMRCIMIRHSQKQTYRGTTTTLMSLPPKVERKIEIEFTDEEKQEYMVLDNAARDFYLAFKANKGHELSKHFLLLSQKLTPLRIAASGGQIPLDDEEENDDPEVSADESAGEQEAKKKRKEERFSDFVYRSKLDILMAELKRARDEDPHAKSLVFSQFASTLKWLQKELPNHGFQFRTLSGDMPMKKRAKALHDFQHDPPTTIFLLSMRAGAVGINLTQANRVFLMEPSFNPALEAQAIGRVHRLGQKRNVEVVRLIMKDSVESRILEMLDKKYGSETVSADDEEVDGKVLAIATLVGSIQTDRTKVLGDEFDLLFGTGSLSSDEAEAEADPVSSSTSINT